MVRSMVLAGLAGVLSGTLLAGTAEAGGFAIREQSAEGQGASFAGVAAGTNGLSSMFWNPATSSQHNAYGFISESNVSAIMARSEADGPGPYDDSGNIGELAFVPSSYYVYGVNDRLTLGLSLNAPLGLVTDARDTWIGGLHGDRSDVATYNLSPSASYKVNDWLSIGIGAQVEYMTVELTARQPVTGFKFLDAEADSLGVGFTAGLLFEPTPTTDIGIGFRSSIKHDLKGDGTFLLGRVPYDGDMAAGFSSPETVTIGIRQQVNEQLTLLAGVEWANWSRFKELRLELDPPFPSLATPENWKDSWFFSLGGEYAVNEALMLRAGAAYEISPVPDAYRTPRVPDNDRVWLSLGASYKLAPSTTAHIAYSHVFVDDGDINLTAPAPLVASFDQCIDILSVGLTHDW